MSPSELSTLAAEIHNDPAALGYASLLPNAPGHVVDLLNAPTQTMVKQRFVTARTIQAECADGAAILDALQALTGQVSDVKWIMVFLQQDSGVDIGHPRTLAKIDGLVTGAGFSEAYAAQLKAMPVQAASRAEVLGLPVPDVYDLIASGAVQ